MRMASIDRRKRPLGETAHQPDLMVANSAKLAATLTLGEHLTKRPEQTPGAAGEPSQGTTTSQSHRAR